SVKDSVVGEERIAQYLLVVLNTQGTPLHWKHLNSRRLEGIQYDSKEKHEYNLKDLRPKRTKPPNDSNMLYIDFLVMNEGTPLHWKHLNSRRLEGIQYDSKEKHEYNLKDLRPKRTKPPNDSDMLYIELI
ncbi:short integuments 2, partial [Quercus suber]